MSDAKAGSTTAIERVTIDDLRHRAEAVKSKAVAEAKGAVDVVVGDQKRTLMIIAGVVIVAAGIAYYLGAQAGRRDGLNQILGE